MSDDNIVQFPEIKDKVHILKFKGYFFALCD